MRFRKYKRHVVLGPSLAYDDIFELSKSQYETNGTLAILCNHYDEDGDLEFDCDAITVNLSHDAVFSPESRLAYVDTNNNRGIDAWLEEQGIAKTVGVGYSGFCAYPLMEFDKKFIEELPTEDDLYEFFCSVGGF